MNKILSKGIFTMTLFAACSTIALADGNAFTPLNFDDTAYGVSKQTAVQAVQNQQVGNENLQNAILQLDNAQVDVRNQLLDCKTKFAEIDAQYRTIKQERDAVSFDGKFRKPDGQKRFLAWNRRPPEDHPQGSEIAQLS